jgi:hypothetical protein
MSEKDNVISFADKVVERMTKNKKIPREITFDVTNNLEKTMTDEEKNIVTDHIKYFYTGNDLGIKKYGFSGWRPCGSYDFNNPPIKSFDNYIFGLEPKFLSNLLEYVCSTKGDGNKMYHCAMMTMNYDVFTVKNPGTEGPEYETFFNSHLVSVTEESEKKEEVSAFYPGLTLKIERPKACLVAYQDVTGQKCFEELQGDWCRYFLQGYELSRGRQFFKNAGDITLHKQKKARKKILGNIWDGVLI